MALFSKKATSLPTTSSGYVPPDGATARGWRCPNPECSTTNVPAPRRWPFPCPSCGVETDPDFDEPWATEAKGPWLRQEVIRAERIAADGGWAGGVPFYKSELEAWTYADAQRRGARDDAHAAQTRLHTLIDSTRESDPSFFAGMARAQVVLSALSANDPDSGAVELTDWLRFVPTDNVEEDNAQRTNVRQVIQSIVWFVERFPTHSDTNNLLATCGELITQAEPVLSNAVISEYRAVTR